MRRRRDPEQYCTSSPYCDVFEACVMETRSLRRWLDGYVIETMSVENLRALLRFLIHSCQRRPYGTVDEPDGALIHDVTTRSWVGSRRPLSIVLPHHVLHRPVLGSRILEPASLLVDTSTLSMLCRGLWDATTARDPSYALPFGRYTLEPLRTMGEASLACSDIRGIKWITLQEIHMWWGGPETEVEVRSASDLFAAMRRRHQSLPSRAHLLRARFHVQFHHKRQSRRVTIAPPYTASYGRDSDALLVEHWMCKRGFWLSAANEGRPRDGCFSRPAVAHS